MSDRYKPLLAITVAIIKEQEITFKYKYTDLSGPGLVSTSPDLIRRIMSR